MNVDALEKRITLLEDREAIRQLKARYCAACDDNYNAEAIAALFTEDGVWDGAGFGRFAGRAAIRSFFRKVPQRMAFAIHQVSNPIIEIDGERARGQWYLLSPCTVRRESGNQAYWLGAVYHEEYLKLGGQWLIKSLRGVGRLWAPYERGWASAPAAAAQAH